ncbi:hypothetical protein [Streptomyces cinnamoneus]|uniref:Lipoprotein n=1 Tax=Streptomyces cinnamoneus TaxID=53446 RepID=A0A918TVF4_STRCJ|nr:hypothetical protein [Streptomyces cinnamoneus]GHC60677.1 hypothetical protein GCM10010507_42100 [Streptomyces cinnamoneus]
MGTRPGTRRGVAALGTALGAALVLALAGCDSDSQGRTRAERETATAYVDALNARDADALAALGRPGREGAAEDARGIVAERGGQGLKVTGMDVTHEFGPDFADVAITATDGRGRDHRERLALERDGKTWYVPLGRKAGGTPKPSSGTSRPG